MMTPTCAGIRNSGRGAERGWVAGSVGMAGPPGPWRRMCRLNLHDFLFLSGKNLVDVGDRRIRCLLHQVGVGAAVVLRHHPVLLELLEQVHAVPADVPDGD